MLGFYVWATSCNLQWCIRTLHSAYPRNATRGWRLTTTNSPPFLLPQPFESIVIFGGGVPGFLNARTNWFAAATAAAVIIARADATTRSRTCNIDWLCKRLRSVQSAQSRNLSRRRVPWSKRPSSSKGKRNRFSLLINDDKRREQLMKERKSAFLPPSHRRISLKDLIPKFCNLPHEFNTYKVKLKPFWLPPSKILLFGAVPTGR